MKVLGIIGLAATSLAIIACFIPPPIVAGVTGFELKIVGSVVFMLVCGLSLYAIGRKRMVEDMRATL